MDQEAQTKAVILLAVIFLGVLVIIFGLNLWLIPARVELIPVSEEASRLLEESAHISKEETAAQPGEEINQLESGYAKGLQGTQETNIERARRLAEEEKEYEDVALRLEKEAREKGWNVRRSLSISNREYVLFLEKLLSVEDVIDMKGEGITLYVDTRFYVSDLGSIHVSYDASMEEVISFLKN